MKKFNSSNLLKILNKQCIYNCQFNDEDMLISIINNLISSNSIDELSLILFSCFNSFDIFENEPHLFIEPQNDYNEFSFVMTTIFEEINRRLEVLNELDLENIHQYNIKSLHNDHFSYLYNYHLMNRMIIVFNYDFSLLSKQTLSKLIRLLNFISIYGKKSGVSLLIVDLENKRLLDNHLLQDDINYGQINCVDSDFSYKVDIINNNDIHETSIHKYDIISSIDLINNVKSLYTTNNLNYF